MRAKGVGWMRMPLFTWSVLISVFIPSFGPASIRYCILLTIRFYNGIDILHIWSLNHFCSSICSGSLDIIFFSLVVVPAFGIVSEVLFSSARRYIFGYKSMVYRYGRNWCSWIHCVGTPHANKWYES